MKVIPKNFHISWNDWSYPVLTNGMTREVTFPESCKYDIGKEQQADWNKLFGYSYGILPHLSKGKLYSAAHWNSDRIGWRWNPKIEKIEICSYYYINGQVFFPEKGAGPIVVIGELDKKYILSVIPHDGDVIYYLDDIEFHRHPLQSKKKLGWKLCFFFGGTRKAVHTTKAMIK